ncbi:MAG: 2-iminoacetate synthase ThiH [Deltaproteobacteria bacterium]|nr:2-iminoacetate synthase ThiH [Deltaproteobacteria bacterium]
MGYYDDVYSRYRNFDFDTFFRNVTAADVPAALTRERHSAEDFLTLLSPAAGNHLEEMAQKAHHLTVRNFGRVIFLFTPIYLSDYCENQCAYCGFNVGNPFARKKLNLQELEEEARRIAETDLKHVLILTGESRQYSPPSYIRECVQVLKKYFSSISVEIYPLDTEEYGELVTAGVDGLTIYQEVYHEKRYDQVHLAGPKKNFHYRLDAPERGCRAGMRAVTVGPLLGLDDWRREVFFAGIHADYLQNRHWNVEIGLSFPRFRPHAGDFRPARAVDNRSFIQALLASRLFLPRAGITVSTREDSVLRNHILPLGVTKMSAGSSTEVGGRLEARRQPSQFEIADHRTVGEMKETLLQKGYQPIFKDWHTV